MLDSLCEDPYQSGGDSPCEVSHQSGGWGGEESYI